VVVMQVVATGVGSAPSRDLTAARQAGLILLVSGVFTLTAPLTSPIGLGSIAAVAAGHIHAAALAFVLPWRSWPSRASLVLALAMLGLLGLTGWVFDGFASGVGPLFVLVFCWLGLHHPRWTLALALPLAVAAYAGGLVAAEARPRLVWSTAVVMPVAALVGALIEQRVRALRATQQALQSKDRWRGALMATLAHDVRSPLSTVTGVLEVLEDDPVTPQHHRPLLASAQRQAARILRLAVGMLEVERAEHGMLRLDLSEVSLHQLATEVAALTDPGAVCVDIDRTLLARVDPARLEQVLYNLTSNALRHGAAPVVLSATADGDAVELRVRDHGVGVPDLEVDRLFDRFSSADHSPQSVGLGLWIVRLLTEAHGGDVRYEDAAPGATFVVRLPESRVRAVAAQPV
jgi:signal transduction histidine kinase